jgi:hypothetical protein
VADGDVETYYDDGVWKNRPQGNQRASNTAPTKAEAEATGRQMAIDRGRRTRHQEEGRHDRREEHLSTQ